MLIPNTTPQTLLRVVITVVVSLEKLVDIPLVKDIFSLIKILHKSIIQTYRRLSPLS